MSYPNVAAAGRERVDGEQTVIMSYSNVPAGGRERVERKGQNACNQAVV